MATNEVAERKSENTRMIRPRYSIRQDEGVVTAFVEMPGVAKESVSMTIENNEMRILGKRSQPDETGTYLIRERLHGDFYQTFTLDETIDQGKVDASLENGILTVSLHMKEEVKPKMIKIKTS
jgi:HSP20 family protein